jgi:hypothetical protein
MSINTNRNSSFIHHASTVCDEDSEQVSFTCSDRTKKQKKKVIVNDYSESEQEGEDDEEEVSTFSIDIEYIEIPPDKIVRASNIYNHQDTVSDLSSVCNI